jgi:uncharacterized glyoxalase superfamily protein PhnB
VANLGTLVETLSLGRRDSQDIINFDVEDLEQLWQDIEAKCVIETPLAKTPWGSLKFVIRDPDGYKLGFCQRK